MFSSKPIANFTVLPSGIFVRIYNTGNIVLSNVDPKGPDINIDLKANKINPINSLTWESAGYAPSFIRELGQEYIVIGYGYLNNDFPSDKGKLYFFEKSTGNLICSIGINVEFILSLPNDCLLIKEKTRSWCIHQLQDNKLIQLSKYYSHEFLSCDRFYLNPNAPELFGFIFYSSSNSPNFNKMYIFNLETFILEKIILFSFNKEVYKRFINGIVFVNSCPYVLITPEKKEDGPLKSLFFSNLKKQLYSIEENKPVLKYELDSNLSTWMLHFNSVLCIKTFNTPFFGEDYTKISFYPKGLRGFNAPCEAPQEYKFYKDNSFNSTPNQELAVCNLTTGQIKLYPVRSPICYTIRQFFKNICLPNSLARNEEFPPFIVNSILKYSGLYKPLRKSTPTEKNSKKTYRLGKF